MNPATRTTVLSGIAAALAALALAPAALAVEQTFVHYRWTPTKLRNDAGANSIQVAEFQFFLAGEPVSWTDASVANPGGDSPGGESPPNIIDGDTGSKWLDFNKMGLIFTFPAATTVDAYRFATANDATERDPVSWTLEGSDDLLGWTLIDVVKNHPTTTDRFTYQSFTLPASLVPEILSFQPSGTVVLDGATQDLSWTIDRADSATISHGVGAVDPISGTVAVNPPDNADTAITLTATSAGGSSTASVVMRSVIGGSVAARFVRFTPLKLRSGTMIQLAEFSFYADSVPVAPVDVTNPGGSNAPTAGEGALMAIDNNTATKWLDGNMQPLVFDFGSTASFNHYQITTANDAPERDPLRWIMEASDDGSTWHLIENMTPFDFNLPTARFTDSQRIPLPGASLVPLLSASSDFASILVGESVNLTWQATGAATVTCEPGIGALDPSGGTLAVSPTVDTTYVFSATAPGAGIKTASVFIQVANPSVSSIAYANFDSAGSELNLRSTAAVVNAVTTLPQGGDVKRLRITPDVGSSVGAAWFRYKQEITHGFECAFGFQFTTAQPNNGADGMAFVIHNDPRKTEAMPATMQENGLPANALNVSLDSYRNDGEASAARVVVRNGVTVLTAVNLAGIPGLALFTTDQGADLTDTARTGNPFQVRIRYVPGDLDVFVNNLQVVSNLNVNLSATGALDGENKGYVGFTARTGGSFENHDVTSWYFTPTTADYANWVAGFHGLADPAAGADPDADGIINLMEYVLNGNPGSSSTGILPTTALDAGANLRFTFVRRAESKADTVQTFQSSTDLETWSDTPIPATTAGNVEIVPDSPAAGLERVTITLPAAGGRLFGRLRVTGL
jgi:hypothetical protein